MVGDVNRANITTVTSTPTLLRSNYNVCTSYINYSHQVYIVYPRESTACGELPLARIRALVVLYGLEHGTLGVPLLAGVGELRVGRRVAHGVHLRMGVGALALIGAVGGGAVRRAAGDDGCRQPGLRRGHRAGLRLGAERQIEGREVAALRKRRRHDEIAVRLVVGRVVDLRRRAVLLIGWAELGQLGHRRPVQFGGVIRAELPIVLEMLGTVPLDLVLTTATRRQS